MGQAIMKRGKPCQGMKGRPADHSTKYLLNTKPPEVPSTSHGNPLQVLVLIAKPAVNYYKATTLQWEEPTSELIPFLLHALNGSCHLGIEAFLMNCSDGQNHLHSHVVCCRI